MGVITIGVTVLTALLGMITVNIMHFYKGDKAWTDYDKARYFSGLHRYFGYSLLLLANATCMTGVINYVQKQIKRPEYNWYFIFTLPLFLLAVGILEVKHRLKDSKGELDLQLPPGTPSMTQQELSDWIRSGKNLAVIDNLVLDQSNYAALHPGGKFSVEHTCGRDISKYFYGGFALLADGTGRPAYTHSLKALSVAQSMVVAVLKG